MFIIDQDRKAHRLHDVPPFRVEPGITVLCLHCGQPVEAFQQNLGKALCWKCENDLASTTDLSESAGPMEAWEQEQRSRRQAVRVLTRALEQLLFER